MKFNYEYRTSDNRLHEGVIRSANREEAFAVLKARGIRPGRVVEAPGFFNKLFGKGKRWLAIVFLAVALIVAVVFLLKRPRSPLPQQMDYDVDPAILEQFAAMGHKAEDIKDFLEARRKLNNEYRSRIEAQVKNGTMSKSDANDLLVAIGLKPLD